MEQMMVMNLINHKVWGIYIFNLFSFYTLGYNENLFSEQEQTSWQCVWSATTAIPVVHLAFSPDGTLFATCGENDRLVKIWYENRHGKSSFYVLKSFYY